MTKHTDTSRSGGLVERLRETNWGPSVTDTLTRWDNARREAADRIEALEGKVERLLARLAHAEDDCEDDCIYCEERRQEIARAALGEKQ